MNNSEFHTYIKFGYKNPNNKDFDKEYKEYMKDYNKYDHTYEDLQTSDYYGSEKYKNIEESLYKSETKYYEDEEQRLAEEAEEG